MPVNKRLPILKLILLPIFLGTGYGAYCYYMQQYIQNEHKIHAPIRYMQQLHKRLTESEDIDEVARIYMLMSKHIDQFVIDPSNKNQKLNDAKVDRNAQTEIKTKFKIDKSYQINYFNEKIVKKDGKFILGLWIDLNQILMNSIRNCEPMLRIAEKSLKMRNKKCRTLAQAASTKLQKGYLLQYIQCINSTVDHAAKLQTQIDIGRKINNHQLKTSFN